MNLPDVYLVRHGETAWTLSGQHTGRTDIPLTARGEDEARALQPRLLEVPFTAILSSPLQRARRTCELAGFGAAAADDPDLMEWDYGACEGRRTVDIQVGHPGWRMFEDGCPAGEGADDVGARADRVIARVRARGGHVALFAHRDLLRVLTARWLGLPAREGRLFYLETASISVLGYNHDLTEPVIRRWNSR